MTVLGSLSSQGLEETLAIIQPTGDRPSHASPPWVSSVPRVRFLARRLGFLIPAWLVSPSGSLLWPPCFAWYTADPSPCGGSLHLLLPELAPSAFNSSQRSCRRSEIRADPSTSRSPVLFPSYYSSPPEIVWIFMGFVFCLASLLPVPLPLPPERPPSSLSYPWTIPSHSKLSKREVRSLW